MLGWSMERDTTNDSDSHFTIGRSSAKVRARFRKMPTDTGSRRAITASKIGRSRSGPVEKYSSSDMAGAHSCDWPRRPNWR